MPSKKKYKFSQFKVVRCDDGIEEDYIQFELIWKKKPRNRSMKCGAIAVTIAPTELNYIEHSVVDEHIRGTGIGYKFYEAVMKELGYISSDYFEASPAARRVWNKLSKNYFYQTNFFEGTITVYNRKKKTENKY